MQPVRIHAGKSPRRLHYIVEWAEKRGLTQADIMRATGADKGLVSRWFKGTLPGEAYLVQLAELYDTTTDGLFRDPDDDWIAQFLRDRNADERRRIEEMLKLAFPRKTGTEG